MSPSSPALFLDNVSADAARLDALRARLREMALAEVGDVTSGSRRVALGATALVIVAGLALRRFGPGAGLPFKITKYGGSILWGAMVYGLVTAAVPRAGLAWRLGAAMLIATAVELVRLVHTPALDAFRSSTAGALLLGRVVSPWDIAAYTLGIIAMALATRGPSDLRGSARSAGTPRSQPRR